MCDKFNGDYNF